MMKKVFCIAVFALFSLQSEVALGQDNQQNGPNFPKLDASPMDLALYRNGDDDAVARVIYSRPQKRDREVFGKLVPFGQVWRTGANEATELTLYEDMMVGNTTIDAGTYTVYTIPEQNEWTVILNNRVHTWGAYEYTDKEDQVRIKVPVRKSPTTIEAFSMAFVPQEEGADLLMGWDDQYVEIPFKPANGN